MGGGGGFGYFPSKTFSFKKLFLPTMLKMACAQKWKPTSSVHTEGILTEESHLPLRQSLVSLLETHILCAKKQGITNQFLPNQNTKGSLSPIAPLQIRLPPPFCSGTLPHYQTSTISITVNYEVPSIYDKSVQSYMPYIVYIFACFPPREKVANWS